MVKKKLVRKDRGAFLTLVIVLDAIGIFFAFLPSDPIGLYLVKLIFNLLNLVLLVYILYWKKFGVYLGIILGVIQLLVFLPAAFVPFIYNNSSKPGETMFVLICVTIILIIITAIYYWAIFRKWKYFE